MVEALIFGHQSIQPMIDLQEKMAAEVGKPKREVPLFPIDPEPGRKQMHEKAASDLEADPRYIHRSKPSTNAAVDELASSDWSTNWPAEDDTQVEPGQAQLFKKSTNRSFARAFLNEGLRPDGRSLTEIRPIWCEVGISPRAHGSGLFTRGETQVLTLATLGTPKEAQETGYALPDRFQALHAPLQLPALLHRRSQTTARAIPPRDWSWRPG